MVIFRCGLWRVVLLLIAGNVAQLQIGYKIVCRNVAGAVIVRSVIGLGAILLILLRISINA